MHRAVATLRDRVLGEQEYLAWWAICNDHVFALSGAWTASPVLDNLERFVSAIEVPAVLPAMFERLTSVGVSGVAQRRHFLDVLEASLRTSHDSCAAVLSQPHNVKYLVRWLADLDWLPGGAGWQPAYVGAL